MIQTNAKEIATNILFSAFFIFIIVYAFFRSHDLIFGIKIKHTTINDLPAQELSSTKENILKIAGNAKNAVSLTLNGREISINQDGDFEETLVLLLGYNTINLEARDKFGYSDKQDYKLTYMQ